MATPKVHPFTKTEAPADPQVTPWSDEDLEGPTPTTRRPRGRSLRDWIVLGLAALLFVYVMLFLLIGPATPSSSASRSSSGNFWLGGGTIAVIPIHGEISTFTSSSSIGYLDVVDALESAENDSSVQAILLDIDSGGGSVVSSKQIVAKIRETKKPVVSWIGEVGASGAYYAASASTYVMADSDSITGSIGVISHVLTIQELLDKLGVKSESIKTGELKDIGSPFDDLNANERDVLQGLVDEAFVAFKSDVQTFRGDKLKPAAFAEVLDGRILSGRQALGIGLIDQTGTREEAIKKAVELGGIEGTPELKNFIVKPFTLGDLLFSAGSQFGKGFKASWVNTESSAAIEAK